MNSLFTFSDYVDFLRSYIENQPKKGRGLVQKLAFHIGVNPTFVSQVLSGLKNFSIEQGFEVVEFLGLSNIEKDYFLLLIQIKKSGSKKSEKYFLDQLNQIKNKALKLSHRVEQDKSLSEAQSSTFYSSWLYLAIWIFTTFEKGKTLEEIILEFSIPRHRAVEILNFLVETGLCNQSGVFYKAGVLSTHLDGKSPYIVRHHMNWRNRALLRHENITEDELAYSAPMALSKKDFELLREELASWIKKMVGQVKKSPSEKMAFLNIDFLYMNLK